MLRIIGILLFVAVLLVGIPLSAFNSEPVVVNYLIATGSWPLSLVLVAAFSLGIVVATIISLGVVLPLRLRLARMENTSIEQAQEIGNLRKQRSASAAH